MMTTTITQMITIIIVDDPAEGGAVVGATYKILTQLFLHIIRNCIMKFNGILFVICEKQSKNYFNIIT